MKNTKAIDTELSVRCFRAIRRLPRLALGRQCWSR